MKLLTSKNGELMDVQAVRTNGSNLVVYGAIMGVIPVEAVITPKELRSAFKLVNMRLILFIVGMLFKK